MRNATFYDGAQTQWKWLYGLTREFQLTPKLNEKTILSMQQWSGNYTGAEPEDPLLIPNGIPFVQGDGKQEIRRLGVVEDLTWTIGNHVVSTGVCYEGAYVNLSGKDQVAYLRARLRRLHQVMSGAGPG